MLTPDSTTTSLEAQLGIETHRQIEHFLCDLAPPPPLAYFMEEIKELKRNKAQPEVKLAITKQWQPTSWDAQNCWGRAILDALVVTPSKISIVDFKTGKPHHVAHWDQARTYAAFVDAHYPARNQDYIVTFYYTTLGRSKQHLTSQDELIQIRTRLKARALRMETDTQLLPRPNKYVCRICKFSKICDYVADPDPE
jgi:ATP-dependent exoDNAse (exonuclease V) beta subunit